MFPLYPMQSILRVFLRVRVIQLLVLTVLSGLSLPLWAQDAGPRIGSQIIDDTTKQIYGPTTSLYFYESDIFYNQDILRPIDTVISNFHRFTYVQRNNHLYQDLGNVGTAAHPVFYQPPPTIGATPGVNAFDLYWEANRIRYFDTRSPYTNLKLALGGRGRSLTDVTFSRNISPQWNFGFDYRGIFVDKQVQRRGKGDRNVRSTYYDFFTTYYTKDSTYRVFANLARNMYQLYESGGIQTADDFQMGDLFLANIQPELTQAESRELRIRFHLYHQYAFGRGFQLYHQMDRHRQGNQFLNRPSQETYNFDYTEINSDTTSDKAVFRTFRNEAGIKGNLLKLFYNGYYAVRHYSMRYKYIQEDTLQIPTKGNEHYIGGRMALQLDSLMELRGAIEILLDENKALLDGNYRIEGQLRSRWLEASLRQSTYSPGFAYQAYRGSHDVWSNNFNDVEVTQLNGYLHYRSRILTLSPGLTFTRLRNYVFFEQDTSRVQDVLPMQSDGNQIIASPELKFALTFLRNITLSGRAIYTTVLENANEAIRVPDLFVNGQLSYSNIHFNGNLEVHTGVDVHWKSPYHALGYDPVIQQFYTQNSFKTPGVPIIDVFLNAKIKRARIFLKYHNLFKTFNDVGYVLTPYYPGQLNVIDFGFDWSFYD